MNRRGTMTEADPEARRGGDWLAAAAWLLAAAALRFVALGQFSLWGDELYSIEDAATFGGPDMEIATLAFPLFYVLERLVLSLCDLTGSDASPQALQFASRIIPAAAGSLAAAAAFLAPRGLLARRERHLLAAAMTFSPWLFNFSQTARFYTLVLLFSIVATFAWLKAARDERRPWVSSGYWAAGLMLLAILAQPTALLLLGGLVAAALVNALLRFRPFSKALLPSALLPVVLMLPALVQPKVVFSWLLYRLNVQDAGVESVGGLLQGIGYNVGPAFATLALFGLPVLWRRDRGLAVEVAIGSALPTLLLVVLAVMGKSVEQRYLLPILPLVLISAAAFLRELADAVAQRLPSARLAVPLLAFIPWLPGVVSEYVDGNRHDLSGAAALVRSGLEPDDGIIAEGHGLLLRYLPPDLPTEVCLEAPPPRRTVAEIAQMTTLWQRCRRVWVVIPADWSEAGDLRLSFHQWSWTEGRLVREFWPKRWDYHQNRLLVFLVETKSAQKWWPGWTPK